MANLNKVHLIGRLTRDPESRTFANGGKVTNFGFAVNNRKKNQQTGEWDDEPVWLEVKAFNRGESGKLADLCEQYLRKGHQAYIEGHLVFEQWESSDGTKRQALKIVADSIQFLQPKEKDAAPSSNRPNQGDGRAAHTKQPTSSPKPPAADQGDLELPPSEDIPF